MKEILWMIRLKEKVLLNIRKEASGEEYGVKGSRMDKGLLLRVMAASRRKFGGTESWRRLLLKQRRRRILLVGISRIRFRNKISQEFLLNSSNPRANNKRKWISK